MPNEKYSFNFTIDEVKEINRALTNHKKLIAFQILYLFIFMLLIVFSILFFYFTEIFLGMLLIYTIFITAAYFRTKTSLKANMARIAGNTYQYEFYEDEILVNVEDAISTRTVHIKYTDITNTKNCKTLLAFQYANQYYFLRKADLIENAKITTI